MTAGQYLLVYVLGLMFWRITTLQTDWWAGGLSTTGSATTTPAAPTRSQQFPQQVLHSVLPKQTAKEHLFTLTGPIPGKFPIRLTTSQTSSQFPSGSSLLRTQLGTGGQFFTKGRVLKT